MNGYGRDGPSFAEFSSFVETPEGRLSGLVSEGDVLGFVAVGVICGGDSNWFVT